MKCDICGKEVNDNETEIGSKLCISCFSMVYDEKCIEEEMISENKARPCSACNKTVYSFYKIEDKILCGSCFEGNVNSNVTDGATSRKELACTSRISKVGIISALTFLIIFAASFSFVSHSARTNPGDSGESGILLLPFVSPWAFMIPESLIMSPIYEKLIFPLMSFFALLNSFLIYLFFGGAFALTNKKKDPSTNEKANKAARPDR